MKLSTYVVKKSLLNKKTLKTINTLETLLTHAKSLMTAFSDYVGLLERVLEQNKTETQSEISSIPCTHPDELISFNRNDVEYVYMCKCGHELNGDEIDSFLQRDKEERLNRKLRINN